MAVRELPDVIAARALARGPLALATVVAVAGSAYRRPGARLLVGESGRLAGGVSGGCLEADVTRKALQLSAGRARVLRYDSTDDDVGLGCNGVVDVLIERLAAGPLDPLAFAAAALEGAGPAVMVTVYRGPQTGARLLRAADGAERTDLTGPLLDAAREVARVATRSWSGPLAGADVFVEVLSPPARVVVFGTGLDVVPVVALGRTLGWRVIVVGEAQPAVLRRRFEAASEVIFAAPADAVAAARVDARTLAVVMTHSLERDRVLLPALLRSPARYVGLLGPRARAERLLGGFAPTAAQRQRLHAPIGLDLGAEEPEEIALSIVSELQCLLVGGSGRNLRDRPVPIHAG